MFTSNFKTSGRHPDAVAISNGTRGYDPIRKCRALAPPMWAVKRIRAGEMTEAEFTEIYTKQLAGLDAKKIAKELGEKAILLCWEGPGEFCHRHLAAAWFEKQLGVPVRELLPAAKAEPRQQRLL